MVPCVPCFFYMRSEHAGGRVSQCDIICCAIVGWWISVQPPLWLTSQQTKKTWTNLKPARFINIRISRRIITFVFPKERVPVLGYFYVLHLQRHYWKFNRHSSTMLEVSCYWSRVYLDCTISALVSVILLRLETPSEFILLVDCVRASGIHITMS